ncbi:putative paired amphipathic helix protein Sin3-like 1-like [Capsicum annuum]|nr:putative paired amphipathic helix protein Sin3-like 1-like [Capsicum annuum]
MAGNDSQKQFLTLIRDFASEKSQGERRIINQRKQIQELQSELEIANAEAAAAKNEKEIAEQELKGYEVELAMNESAIQILEERIALIQDELSAYGVDLEALKVKSYPRDDFIEKMLELNAKIRKFHESVASIFRNDNCSDSASNPGPAKAKAEDVEAFKRDQNKLAQILEEELSILERKASLIEEITKENKEIQELARYP